MIFKTLFNLFTEEGCYVCRKIICDKPIEEVSRRVKVTRNKGIYGSPITYLETRYRFFHPDCVRDVLSFPEKYGNAMVDRAIHITECLEEQDKRDNEQKSKLLKAAERRSNKIRKAQTYLSINFHK